jgi:hypothetical protein
MWLLALINMFVCNEGTFIYDAVIDCRQYDFVVQDPF